MNFEGEQFLETELANSLVTSSIDLKIFFERVLSAEPGIFAIRAKRLQGRAMPNID
jgi:hypothetical protein